MLELDVPPRDVRNVMVGTRMTDAEHQRLKAAARKRGLMVATVIRSLAMQWADNVLKDDE